MNDKVKTRVYLVEITGQAQPRLVRATFPHIAERHATAHMASARLPTQDELIECTVAGIKVEDAHEEARQAELPVT
ncbi:hypothetical protein GCM10028796_47040 [Ramlibacter monticola]|uniref:Uncharacterized protein n=1 Tax=Ramlibacter monticola TaxID=1926872 RepID=A0A936Z3H4_9BURK|nr:hypothetical protein [Ramlibacter monticola]MBL0394328.1 hypothetical protein [Ramlibacter monticola]